MKIVQREIKRKDDRVGIFQEKLCWDNSKTKLKEGLKRVFGRCHKYGCTNLHPLWKAHILNLGPSLPFRVGQSIHLSGDKPSTTPFLKQTIIYNTQKVILSITDMIYYYSVGVGCRMQIKNCRPWNRMKIYSPRLLFSELQLQGI